jgi:hypothetical protein
VSIVTFDTRQQQDGDLKISVLRVVYWKGHVFSNAPLRFGLEILSFRKDRGSPYPNVVFNETGEEEARDRDNGLVER